MVLLICYLQSHYLLWLLEVAKHGWDNVDLYKCCWHHLGAHCSCSQNINSVILSWYIYYICSFNIPCSDNMGTQVAVVHQLVQGGGLHYFISVDSNLVQCTISLWIARLHCHKLSEFKMSHPIACLYITKTKMKREWWSQKCEGS